jgi:hypothetical protein
MIQDWEFRRAKVARVHRENYCTDEGCLKGGGPEACRSSFLNLWMGTL